MIYLKHKDASMCQKTKQMLCFILKDDPRDVTSLIKLSYLIDLAAVRKLGQKISEFEYIRYNYGPFDPKVYANLNELQKDGLVISVSHYTNYGENVLFKMNAEDADSSMLSEPEKELIADMLSSLKGYGARMLTDIAYATQPMQSLGATLGGNEHLGEILNLFAV